MKKASCIGIASRPIQKGRISGMQQTCNPTASHIAEVVQQTCNSSENHPHAESVQLQPPHPLRGGVACNTVNQHLKSLLNQEAEPEAAT